MEKLINKLYEAADNHSLITCGEYLTENYDGVIAETPEEKLRYVIEYLEGTV